MDFDSKALAQLISEVKGYPFLYDSQQKTSRVLENEAWHKIARNLNTEHSADSCNRKWQDLLDKFHIEVNLVKEDPKYESKWGYYDEMSFLQPHLKYIADFSMKLSEMSRKQLMWELSERKVKFNARDRTDILCKKLERDIVGSTSDVKRARQSLEHRQESSETTGVDSLNPGHKLDLKFQKFQEEQKASMTFLVEEAMHQMRAQYDKFVTTLLDIVHHENSTAVLPVSGRLMPNKRNLTLSEQDYSKSPPLKRKHSDDGKISEPCVQSQNSQESSELSFTMRLIERTIRDMPLETWPHLQTKLVELVFLEKNKL